MVMYSSRVHRMVEEWSTCMRLLSWRRHQGTVLESCILILLVSDPAKQAAQAVKHHMFDERTAITLEERSILTFYPQGLAVIFSHRQVYVLFNTYLVM